MSLSLLDYDAMPLPRLDQGNHELALFQPQQPLTIRKCPARRRVPTLAIAILAATVLTGLHVQSADAESEINRLQSMDGSLLRTGGLGDTELIDPPVAGQDDTGDLVTINPLTAGKTGLGGMSATLVNAIQTSAAGEIVSAVVPPFVKQECPAGRLLLSLDGVKDPTGGSILGRDLDNLNGDTTQAVLTNYYKYGFLETGLAEVRRILSNDQDLVALPNGDVLYTRMGQTRATLPADAVWFNHAYKMKDGKFWGPGARSEILVFRSQDCGTTFRMESGIDSAGLLNGVTGQTNWSGGLPQTCKDCPVTLPNGTGAYQMAGTDGPHLTVDHATGHALLSVGIFGMLPAPGADGEPFGLSNERVNKTVVLRSIDRGDTWQRVAVLDYRAWRLEIVGMGGGLLGAADYNWVEAVNIPPMLPADDISNGYTASLPDTVDWGGPFRNPKSGINLVRSFRGQTHSSGLPEPGLQLVLVRDTDDGTQTGRKGWRVYGYDWTNPAEGFTEFLPPIMPVTDGERNFIFNPVLIDPGAGPRMVYWYDVTTYRDEPLTSHEVQIRGRFILGRNQQTADFAISEAFPVTKANWFGHYQKAGGFYRIEPDGLRRTVVFPVWTQPDGHVRFRHLEYHELGPRPNQLGQVRPGVIVTAGERRARTQVGPRPEFPMDWLKEHEAEENEIQLGTNETVTRSR